MDRDVLRNDAYGDPSKLMARQRLWRYVDVTRTSGRISRVLALTGDETVVDMGSGNGRDLVALRADGHRGPVIGIDLSLGMVSSIDAGIASRVNADAMLLPIADGCADVVSAMHMLYHVPDIPAALVEAGRVLRHGGVFVCSTNSKDAVPELVEVWSEAMQAVGGPPLERPSHNAFSVETGEPLLREHFASVVLHPNAVTSRVPSADVVRDYIASTDDFYRPRLPDPDRWPEVLDHVHRRCAEVIAEHGTFDVSQRSGTFVCR